MGLGISDNISGQQHFCDNRFSKIYRKITISHAKAETTSVPLISLKLPAKYANRQAFRGLFDMAYTFSRLLLLSVK